jgi:hypothetical protein
MIWQILFIYCVVAELVFFCWIWSSFDPKSESLTSVCDISKLSPFQKFRFYAVCCLMMAIAAPFALPVMVYFLIKCYRAARVEHEEKYGYHLEMSLEPLHVSNVPEDLAVYIEEHLPAATGMKFEMLGDYWLKGEPYNSKARIFLNEDLTCFAEIGVVIDTLYCELISFLEDGSMIGTGSCPPFCKPYSREKNGYYINLIGHADMLETIESHMEFLAEVSQRAGQAVQRISRENWKEFYHYHNHKYGQIQFERGEAKTAPESCEIPWSPSVETALKTSLVN